MPEVDFIYETKVTKVMVDFKFMLQDLLGPRGPAKNKSNTLRHLTTTEPQVLISLISSGENSQHPSSFPG